MLYRGLLHVAVVLGNRGLVLSRMHLRSDKGFETRVIESFELANSKKRLFDRISSVQRSCGFHDI